MPNRPPTLNVSSAEIPTTVIVRAAGDEPLVRELRGRSQGVCLIAAPGKPGATAFPAEDVFQYDEKGLRALKAALAAGRDDALARAWSVLVHL